MPRPEPVLFTIKFKCIYLRTATRKSAEEAQNLTTKQAVQHWQGFNRKNPGKGDRRAIFKNYFSCKPICYNAASEADDKLCQ